MIEIDVSRFIPGLDLFEAAKSGETIVLTRWGKPVAEVKPLPAILEPPGPIAPPGSMPGAGQAEDHPDPFAPSILLFEDELEELLAKARAEGRAEGRKT